jgi:hypothetical protein
LTTPNQDGTPPNNLSQPLLIQAAEVDAAKALERVEKLLDKVRETGTDLRTVVIAFFGLLLYLDVTIVGIEDLALLVVGKVKLPLAEVEIPIVQFFWATPALVFLVHLHILVQHVLFSQQLFHFKQEKEKIPSAETRKDLMRRVGGYPFIHWLLDGHHSPAMQRLLDAVVPLFLFVWPLWTLILIEGRFLPYHDWSTTLWQGGIVVADLALIAWLWAKLLAPDDDAWRWWTFTPTVDDKWKRLLFGYILFSFSGNAIVLMASPDFYPGIGTILGFHRHLEIREQIIIGAPSPVTPEIRDAFAWDAKAKAPTEAEKDLLKITGAALQGRDLRYAHLERSSLPKADLRGTDLADAVMDHANLTGARLEPDEEGHRTNLTGAVLELANLTGAHMEKAKLTGAQMRGADLTGAQMRGAKCHLPSAGESPASGSRGTSPTKKQATPRVTRLPDGPFSPDWIGSTSCKGREPSPQEIQAVYTFWADLACTNQYIATNMVEQASEWVFSPGLAGKLLAKLASDPGGGKKADGKGCPGIQALSEAAPTLLKEQMVEDDKEIAEKRKSKEETLRKTPGKATPDAPGKPPGGTGGAGRGAARPKAPAAKPLAPKPASVPVPTPARKTAPTTTAAASAKTAPKAGAATKAGPAQKPTPEAATGAGR